MWRGGRLLIVVAHPDDETLGCGGELIHWPDCVIVHLTDGSPRDLADARHAGFSSRQDYAGARLAELDCALAHVGGRERRSLHLVDQETWRDLKGLTRQIEQLIRELRPAAILTHPYEGGHPDHDSAACAVQRACANLGANVPQRLECAFYNRYGGQFRASEFIPGQSHTELPLDEKARARKDRMLACFATQRRVLSQFSSAVERFRIAPRYDFSRPPHEGSLHYETLPWGVTSAMWIAAAAQSE